MRGRGPGVTPSIHTSKRFITCFRDKHVFVLTGFLPRTNKRQGRCSHRPLGKRRRRSRFSPDFLLRRTLRHRAAERANWHKETFSIDQTGQNAVRFLEAHALLLKEGKMELAKKLVSNQRWPCSFCELVSCLYVLV
jgi:hypothetical protein